MTGCQTVEIPDFKAHITLPASKDGYFVKTVSKDEGRIPFDLWMKRLNNEPYIIIFAEDWSILRYGVLKNCLTMKCKNAVGAFDNLFYTLDGALKKIPFHP